MSKAPEAFRTISEVAAWLDTPAHVLRFWESRFSEVRPVKRAGGRRYYRPGDMRLLGGIKHLLHDRGMTIRGVQKLLREEGIAHVAAYSQPLDAAEQAGELADLIADEAPVTAQETVHAAPQAEDGDAEAGAPAEAPGDEGQGVPEPAPEETAAGRADGPGHETPPPAPAAAGEGEDGSGKAQAGPPAVDATGDKAPAVDAEPAGQAPSPPPDHAGAPADSADAMPEPATAPDQSDLFALPRPLGADLPDSDPTLLDITLLATPLAARLRERATRRRLSRRHRETLAALLPRLRALADRMDSGAGD